jgi:hypothetical protein
LIARERERAVKEVAKLETKRLQIFEKSIATRRNRAGVIREIGNIKASRSIGKKIARVDEDRLRCASRESERSREKNKINIFEETDTGLL